MSNEEFERYKNFILEQQAQSAVKIAQVEDSLNRMAENVKQLAENTTLLAQGTLARFESTDKRIDDVEERISALVDSQIRTEESLRNLIAVVNRYFSEGRNGKPEA
jgi:multidrug efflux pump subunit AcrA (membrane-fusion protein)